MLPDSCCSTLGRVDRPFADPWVCMFSCDVCCDSGGFNFWFGNCVGGGSWSWVTAGWDAPHPMSNQIWLVRQRQRIHRRDMFPPMFLVINSLAHCERDMPCLHPVDFQTCRIGKPLCRGSSQGSCIMMCRTSSLGTYSLWSSQHYESTLQNSKQTDNPYHWGLWHRSYVVWGASSTMIQWSQAFEE